MRSFAITLLLVLVMILSVINNSIYINRVVDEMVTVLAYAEPSSSPQTRAELEGVQIKWEKEKKHIQVSISHLKIDTVSNLISSLLIYNEHGEWVEYEKTAALLRAALEEIRQLEKFSAENIF